MLDQSDSVETRASVRCHDLQAFGQRFTDATQSEIIDYLTGPAPDHGPRLLCTLNLDHVVNLRRNAAFRKAYDKAHIVTVDGAPVYLYLRAVGAAPREKVTGSDLLGPLLERMTPNNSSPAFMVSDARTAERLARYLMSRGFDRAEERVIVPSFGFEKDPAQTTEICDIVRSVQATHLFVCVGSPKSEIWFFNNGARLGNVYGLCLGSSPNFFVGTQRRAPRLFQKVGMEWVWRVASEPRRLASRYFVSSFGFLGAVLSDLRTRYRT